MKKVQIKSIFEQISEKVFTMTNLDEAKDFIINFVNSKNIKEQDKNQILINIQPIKNIVKLQTYLCNSLLKYEGMSLNNKTEKVEKPKEAV